MWFALRDRRLGGFKFRRQTSIDGYVVDFVCLDAQLIVEIDGGQHTLDVDAARTTTLESAGYCIVRFWNNEVLQNLEGVLSRLLEHLRDGPLTQPSPEGEGF